MSFIDTQQASGADQPAPSVDAPAIEDRTPAVPTSVAMSRRARRRWWIPAVIGGAAAVAAGAVIVAGVADDADDSADTAEVAPIRAVPAEQMDLAEYAEVDGTISYGEPLTIAAVRAGTITAVAEPDQAVDRGDALYDVDDTPVVVLWGEMPIYRELRSGVDDGSDVRVLEENLAALGYTDDGELVVDDEFDSNTRSAVIDWQQDLGLSDDGVVEPADVVVISGPAVVDTTEAGVGTTISSGTPVLAVTVTDDVTTVLSSIAGNVTLTPTVGAGFATGDVAYEIDTIAVPVIVGDVQFERDLTTEVDDGDDVAQLEQALADLGYDADGALVVDRTFDDATATALAEWEDDLGMAFDYGQFEAGQFAVIPDGARVLDVDAERGTDIATDAPVFTAGVTNRETRGAIASNDSDLIAVDDVVEIEFSDGSTTSGTITDIDAASTVAADGSETLGFTVHLDTIPDTVADAYSDTVTIRVTSELVEAATVVPASALVSIGDGRFAVEVVDGATTSFVEVTPGLFADGNVAVDGIEPGTAVVVPE